jgi:hypothetical protein
MLEGLSLFASNTINTSKTYAKHRQHHKNTFGALEDPIVENAHESLQHLTHTYTIKMIDTYSISKHPL